MFSSKSFLKLIVNCLCCSAVVLYMTNIVIDYLHYDVESSVIIALKDTLPVVMSLCSTSYAIDNVNATSDNGIQLDTMPFMKTFKFLDGPFFQQKCIAITEQVHSTAVRYAVNSIQPLTFHLTESVPPVGNMIAFATLENNTKYVLMYNRYTVDRLPFPFTTSCKNYINGQFGCVDECKADLVTCLQNCRNLACHQSLYLRSHYNGEDGYRKVIATVITGSSMTVTYSPQLTFEMLLIYLAGLVNTFSGLSFWNAHYITYKLVHAAYCAITLEQVRRKREIMRRVIKFVIHLLSIAFCIWQTVPLMQDYFNYATQTEYFRGRMYAAIVIIPDVSLCVNDGGRLAGANHTVLARILNSVVVQTSDGEKVLTDKDIEKINLCSKYTVELPKHAVFSCFMVHLSQTDATYTITHRSGQVALFNLTREPTNIWFAVHSPHEQVTLQKLSLLTNGRQPIAVKTLYSFTHHKLLPAPYATKCRHYGRVSRDTLRERCILQFFDHMLDTTMAAYVKCDAMLQPACERIQIDTVETHPVPARHNEIAIDFAVDCERFVMLPKLTLSTFLIYCGMIAGFWLSVCVLSASDYVITICDKLAGCKCASRNCVKKLLSTLIACAMVVTLYDEADKYLSYPVITNTEFNYADMTQLPAFSVCFVNFPGAVTFANIASLDTNATNVSIYPFFYLGAVMHRIQVDEAMDTTTAKYIRQGTLLKVHCTNTTRDQTAIVMIHQANTLSSSGGIGRGFYCSSQSSNAMVKVKSWKTKLLPPPFASGCRFYPISQRDCFEKCIQALTFEKFRHYSYSFPRTLNQTSGSHIIDKAIVQQCKLTCLHSDCDSIEYTVSTAPFEEPNVLFAVDPYIAQSEAQYVAQYPLRNLFLNLCGLVALWCGLAVSDVYGVIQTLIDKLRKVCGCNQSNRVTVKRVRVVVIRHCNRRIYSAN